MEKKIKRICIDLDGVLANMSKDVLILAGHSYEENCIHEYDYVMKKLGKNVFYDLCKGDSFWSNLEKYNHSDELVQFVDNLSNGHWIFLTKSTNDPGCYSGKYNWVQKHYPQHINKLWIARGSKSLMANNHTLLIDDMPYNIQSFIDNQGSGYLWKEGNFTDKDYLDKRYTAIKKIFDNMIN